MHMAITTWRSQYVHFGLASPAATPTHRQTSGTREPFRPCPASASATLPVSPAPAPGPPRPPGPAPVLSRPTVRVGWAPTTARLAAPLLRVPNDRCPRRRLLLSLLLLSSSSSLPCHYGACARDENTRRRASRRTQGPRTERGARGRGRARRRRGCLRAGVAGRTERAAGPAPPEARARDCISSGRQRRRGLAVRSPVARSDLDQRSRRG